MDEQEDLLRVDGDVMVSDVCMHVEAELRGSKRGDGTINQSRT